MILSFVLFHPSSHSKRCNLALFQTLRKLSRMKISAAGSGIIGIEGATSTVSVPVETKFL